MKNCNAYFKAGHADITEAEIKDILGADASERAIDAYQYLKCLLDRAVANNVAYYEMIEDLQTTIEELQQQYKESFSLLHQEYEKKYQRLIAEKGYDRFIFVYEKKESMLRIEVLENRNITKLLEEENISLREEIKQLKNAASSSTALVPVNDEGFSFLETENTNLRHELETLRRVGPSSPARGRARSYSRGQARSLSLSIEDARTKSALENQVVQ